MRQASKCVIPPVVFFFKFCASIREDRMRSCTGAAVLVLMARCVGL